MAYYAGTKLGQHYDQEELRQIPTASGGGNCYYYALAYGLTVANWDETRKDNHVWTPDDVKKRIFEHVDRTYAAADKGDPVAKGKTRVWDAYSQCISRVDGSTPREKWTNFFTHNNDTLAGEGRYSGTPFVGTLFANDALNINLKQFLSSRDGTFKTRQDQNAPGPRVFINNAEGTGRIGHASVVVPRNAPSAAIAAAERMQFEQTGFNFETECRPAIELDRAEIRRIIDGANGIDSRKFIAAAGTLFLEGRHNKNEWVLPQNVEIGLEYLRTGMRQRHAPSFAALGDYRCQVFERATLEGYKEKFNLTGPDEAIRPQFDAHKRETLEVAAACYRNAIKQLPPNKPDHVDKYKAKIARVQSLAINSELYTPAEMQGPDFLQQMGNEYEDMALTLNLTELQNLTEFTPINNAIQESATALEAVSINKEEFPFPPQSGPLQDVAMACNSIGISIDTMEMMGEIDTKTAKVKMGNIIDSLTEKLVDIEFAKAQCLASLEQATNDAERAKYTEMLEQIEQQLESVDTVKEKAEQFEDSPLEYPPDTAFAAKQMLAMAVGVDPVNVVEQDLEESYQQTSQIVSDVALEEEQDV